MPYNYGLARPIFLWLSFYRQSKTDCTRDIYIFENVKLGQTVTTTDDNNKLSLWFNNLDFSVKFFRPRLFMGENSAFLGLAAHLIGGGDACIFRMTSSNVQYARIQEHLMTMAPVDSLANYVNCTDKSLLDYYCLNGGTCLQLVVVEGDNPVLCNCSIGWYGKRCEYHESAGPFYVTEKTVMDYVPFICGAILLFLIVVLTSGSIIYYKKYRRRSSSDDHDDRNQADHFEDFERRNNHCTTDFGLTSVSSTIKRLSRSLSGKINRINNG